LVSYDGDTAATFMTEIARLAKSPPLEPIADEVHDRALVGIARKMKQTLEESGPMRNLPHLFRNPAVWPTPLIGDAQFAVKEASRRPVPAHTKLVTVQAGHSTVTAVCQVPVAGTIFIGLENGEIVSFLPGVNSAMVVTREGGPIQALTMDAAGLYLLALSQRGPEKVCVSAFSREFGYRMNDYTILSVQGPVQLGVPALSSVCPVVVVADGKECRTLGLPGLGGIASGSLVESEETPDLIVYGAVPSGLDLQTWILAIQGGKSRLLKGAPSRRKLNSCALEWRPAIGEHSTLLHAQVQAIFRAPASVEIIGIDDRGRLCRSVIPFNTFGAETSVYTPQGEDRYRAFACVRTDLLAGVNVEGIDWWTPSRTRPVRTRLLLRNPVAAFVLPASHELLIVEADGLLTRVPIAE
jgi:hypothetical protein